MFVCIHNIPATSMVTRVSRSCLSSRSPPLPERDAFVANLLVRIHVIIKMIRWTGLAPWESEIPFPGSLISSFLAPLPHGPLFLSIFQVRPSFFYFYPCMALVFSVFSKYGTRFLGIFLKWP